MYACIDLGSNSFHLLIAEWKNRKIQIIERCSDIVQIGEGVQTTGKISAAAYARGLESLKHFRDLISQHPVKRYWALGTNTFRVASNADLFINDAAVLGIDISVISGVQEAVLIYAGVISSLPKTGEERLVIDIGGGSTEIIVGKRDRRLITHSLSVGCVAWRDRFFTDQSTDLQDLGRCLTLATEAARSLFIEIAPGVAHYQWSNAYASSGTAKMLASVCVEHGYPEGEISLPALQDLRSKLLQAIATAGLVPGLKDRRRDLLLPGFAVMAGLMAALNCSVIQFSASALREGMLDFMVKNRKTMKVLRRGELPDVSIANS
ncbi:MAG: hypothetical protein WD772_09860 [Pseudohongiellaceae bacterium]